MDGLQTQELAGVMEGVKKELEKEKTIKCPVKECGHENAKNRLTCEKCEARLFPSHKSSEEKAITKKAKKVLTKRASGKAKEKKEAKEVKEVKGEKGKKDPAKPKEKKEEKEYPAKGSVREKLLKVIQKHSEGIAMPGIQKEMKIVYRLDSYTQEFEERKLIKSKMEEGERMYFPL